MTRSDWIYLGYFFIALLAVVGLAELFRIVIKGSTEFTRKLVHILVGILIASTPFVLQSKWPMIILGIVFTAVDLFAVKKGMLKGMHGTKRMTYGTVFYPLSFVILVVVLWDDHKIILISSMLIMAISDALAAIVGEYLKNPFEIKWRFERKSFQGSLTFFITASGILWALLTYFPQFSGLQLTSTTILWIALVVAFLSTVFELVSLKGSDNLSVPLGTAFTMYFFMYSSNDARMQFTVGMAFALVATVISYKARFLDFGGSVGAFLLGTFLYGIGGWTFTGPMLTFFILSSILSKLGKKRKNKLLNVFEKSGRRDFWQVFANGGVGAVLLFIWFYTKNDMVYIAYLASIAAVTADTWGTELGVLSKTDPRSILTLKKVPMGTSGGISLWGTLGGALGAGIIAFSGLVFSTTLMPNCIGAHQIIIITLAGVFAGFVDSLLGITIQAQYKCPHCGKVTEKKRHCENFDTELIKGFVWINNDVVNFLCALSGALFVYVFELF